MKFFRPLTLLFLSLLYIAGAKAQLIPLSLEQRIDNATTIFEGQVISQKSYWNENKTHIYTTNLVAVYKIFKGKVTYSEVEIVTKGGIVDNVMETVSHTLALKPGDTGIFTAVANTAKIATNSKHTRLKAYGGTQGFIKYDLEKGNAKDAFESYTSISKDVYPKILKRTKTTLKTLQKAPYKIP